MTKRVFLTIALAQTLCFAQKADFSGSWTLNKAKSNFGSLPEQMIPDAATRTITNDEASMKVSGADKSSRGERALQLTFKLDGSASVNSQRGADVTTNAAWDGAVVVMKSKIDVGGTAVDMEERYSLSADRQVLFNDTKVMGTPIGDVIIKYAYDRATALAGSNAPSFSGTWKMNVAKSTFGSLPEEYRPTAITRVIRHNGPTLLLEINQTLGPGRGQVFLQAGARWLGERERYSRRTGEERGQAEWRQPGSSHQALHGRYGSGVCGKELAGCGGPVDCRHASRRHAAGRHRNPLRF